MDQPPVTVIELVANVDDASAEVLASAMDGLLADGALDAWTAPITMKKTRPGCMLSVLCEVSARERLGRRLMELTGSFGVRWRTWDRVVLDRHHESVTTPFGSVRLKIGSRDGRPLLAKPEFEDAAEAARQHEVPVRLVLDHARGAAATWLREHGGPAAGEGRA